MTFDEYQQKAHLTANTDDLDVYSLGLIGEAGSVAASIKKMKRDKTNSAAISKEISAELGDVLWYVAELATRSKITLSSIAQQNLNKTRMLFSDDNSPFDSEFPMEERFPDNMEFHFKSEGEKVVIFYDGQPIGDPIDDNAWSDDYYRFHDVFHISYATHLGWSPVFRRFLKIKRKSNADVDRIEDGARAVFLEEGISIAVFNQNSEAEGASLFSNEKDIPFSVIEMVKLMTSNLEVKRRGVDSWRSAIASGFRMFDKLRLHDGGIIVCDRKLNKLEFKEK